jgi:hypothetical protein
VAWRWRVSGKNYAFSRTLEQHGTSISLHGDNDGHGVTVADNRTGKPIMSKLGFDYRGQRIDSAVADSLPVRPQRL